jgi:peptide/nickel transport system permease protein
MGLRKYLLKRAVDSLVTLTLVFLLSFFICYQRLEEAKGGLAEQFINYLRFVFIDRFGKAFGYPNTMDYVLSVLPRSMFLLVSSTCIALLAGIAFGAFAFYKHRSKVDMLLVIGFVILIVVPNWWSGLLTLSLLIPWFPAGKWQDYFWQTIPFWSNPLGVIQDFLWHAALPVLSLMLSTVGIYFIVTRNSMVQTSNEPYIITAKAKGVRQRNILLRHILRNAIIPVATTATIAPLFLMNACIPIEKVYSLSGLGTALYYSMVSQAQSPRQYALPTLPAIFLLLSVVTIVIHYVLDILHFHLDPRLAKSMTDGAGLGSFSEGLRWRSRKAKIKTFVKSFSQGLLGKLGLALMLLLISLAVLAPFFPLKDPELAHPRMTNQPPSCEYLFGTDEYGRDVLSRTIWAARASLLEILGALIISIFVGTLVGMISGYYRDQPIAYLLDRVTDVFLSVPLIIVALFFPIEAGSLKWILSVGLSTWAIVAKTVRSQVLVTREKPCIEGAKAIGAGKTRIFLNYVLPDTIGVITANMLYIAGIVILIQTSLDFFGFKRFLWSTDPGRPPVWVAPTLSWGSMLSYGFSTVLNLKTWWVVIPPLTCLGLLGLSLFLIGEKVTEVLNPQLRGSVHS